MSNGGEGNENNPKNHVNGIIPFQTNTTVWTPEAYAVEMKRIQEAKNLLAAYEEKTKAGLEKYLEEKQRLEQMVEEGRIAA